MFVVRLGPLELEKDASAYAYLALLDTGLFAEPVIDADPYAALKRFVEISPGEPRRCEARLRMIAGELGFQLAPTPLEVLGPRAALALVLARGQAAVAEDHDPPWLLEATLEAYSLYLGYRAFDSFSDSEPFSVKANIAGKVSSKIAVLMGGAGVEFGVALYPDYKSFVRMMEGDRPTSVTSMALVLSEEPQYAASVIDEAYGFFGVPLIVHTRRKPKLEDRALLCATLRAAAALRRSEPSSEAMLSGDGLSVSVTMTPLRPDGR